MGNSVPDGAFEGYDQNLRILLDIIIINYDLKKSHLLGLISLLTHLIGYFNTLVIVELLFIMGDSSDATKIWHNNKHMIPQNMVEKLYPYSKNRYTRLYKKIQSLIE